MDNKILKHNNELFTDYRGVSRAASLVAQGIDPDTLEIVSIGGGTRAYSKEIERSYVYRSELSGEQRVRIEINREGLYDMLPEGLFHTLVAGEEVLDEEVMIEDIRKKRKEESEARQFFCPFEIELNHLRLLLELYENRLDMQTSYNDMSNMLALSWPELQLLNSRQRVIWMHFIPEIRHHKNDIRYLERFLNLLLNIHVSIQRRHITRSLCWDNETPFQQPALGTSQLGVNSTTQQHYEYDVEIIEITLGPSYPQLLTPYLPNGKDEKIIRMTIDYLLPATLEHKISYDLLPEVKNTTLCDNLKVSHSVLGHTTYL